MSAKIPSIIADRVSDRAKKTLDLVAKFVEEECIPAEPIYAAQLNAAPTRWTMPPIMHDLKARAKHLGLWNMFLPAHYAAQAGGFTNLEYGLMAEVLGKSVGIAAEATNCAAPDTGNMELLAKFGTGAQKERWLVPLLDGEIRSAYVMTEPGVASSDATNVGLAMTRRMGGWVLDGKKHWISGAMSDRCKLYIIMAKSDPGHADRYKRHSIVLVPSNAKGITIERHLKVIGFDDAPHGHAVLRFENVFLPDSDVVLGPGRGFEVMQGRMGPGRIHHAMRAIGAAERALEWLLVRANDPAKRPFDKQISELGATLQIIAESRIEIDAARLIVMNAASKIDQTNSKSALAEIAEAKIFVPTITMKVIDRAIQVYGAEGMDDGTTPLSYMWAYGRTLRIADGPDEVHLQQLGRNENKRSKEATAKIAMQKEVTAKMFAKYGIVDSVPSLRSNL